MIMSEGDGGKEGGEPEDLMALNASVVPKALGDLAAKGLREDQQAAAVAAAAQERVGARLGAAGFKHGMNSRSGCSGGGSGSSGSVSWLSQPQGDWLTVGLTSGRQVRLQLQVSFMSGLPQLAMQAVATALTPLQQLQLLVQCLLQPEAGSGVLKSEWRAISRVLLAWVEDPGFLARGLAWEGVAGARTPADAAAAGGSGGGSFANVAGFSSLAAVATPASAVTATPLASRLKVQQTPPTQQQHRLSRAAGILEKGPPVGGGRLKSRGSTGGLGSTPRVGFKGEKAAAAAAAGGTPAPAADGGEVAGEESDEDMEMATPSSLAATPSPAAAAAATGIVASPSPFGVSDMDISTRKPSRAVSGTAVGGGYRQFGAGATPSPLATGFGYCSDMDVSTVKPARKSELIPAAGTEATAAAGGGNDDLEDAPLAFLAATPDQGAAGDGGGGGGGGVSSEDMDMDFGTPLTGPSVQQQGIGAKTPIPASVVGSAAPDEKPAPAGASQQQQQQQGEEAEAEAGTGVAAAAGAAAGAMQPEDAWKQLLNEASTKALMAKYSFLKPGRGMRAGVASGEGGGGGLGTAAGSGGLRGVVESHGAGREAEVRHCILNATHGVEGNAGEVEAGLGCSSLIGSSTGAAGRAAATAEEERDGGHHVSMMQVLEALHSLYEDSKLYRTRAHVLPLIGSTLLQLAVKLEAWAYADYYLRDLGPQVVAEAGGEAAAAAVAAVAVAGSRSSSSSSSGMVGKSNPSEQQQQKHAAPADLCRAFTALLAADENYTRWIPHLALKGSSSSSMSGNHLVSRSCQLVDCYRLLSSCTAQCLQLLSSFWATAAATTTPTAAAAGGGGGEAATSQGTGSGSSSSSTMALLADMGFYPGSRSSSSSRAGQSGSQHGSSSSTRQLAVALRDVVLSYSQQLVGVLACQGWSVMDLEGLPRGVALPLREALARCRSHPLTGE
jgi:hypothetical protein